MCTEMNCLEETLTSENKWFRYKEQNYSYSPLFPTDSGYIFKHPVEGPTGGSHSPAGVLMSFGSRRMALQHVWIIKITLQQFMLYERFPLHFEWFFGFYCWKGDEQTSIHLYIDSGVLFQSSNFRTLPYGDEMDRKMGHLYNVEVSNIIINMLEIQ